MRFCVELDIMVKVFRGVAQVVERYFREVEAASSSLVTPIQKNLIITGFRGCQVFCFGGRWISLRHGYGSILLSMGTDIKIVSELLGHSDVSFTYNVYIDIFDRDKQDAVMKLNQI